VRFSETTDYKSSCFSKPVSFFEKKKLNTDDFVLKQVFMTHEANQFMKQYEVR